jgi:TRAP-type C4-dicarboxylate transport system permease small subunit
MKQRDKTWTLVLTGVALVALVLVAGNLATLELQPGSLLPSVEPGPREQPGVLEGSDVLLHMTRITMFIAMIFLPVAILYMIFSPEGRRRLLRSILQVLAFLMLLMAISYAQPQLTTQETEETQPLELPEEVTLPEVTMPAFDEETSPGLVLAITVGLALLITALTVGGVWLYLRRRQQPESTLDQLADEARQALDVVRAGGDLRNAVIRCYLEMAQVIHRERGIQRGHAMTPREFELRLTKAGLPDAAVRELTRLFEDVRYGTTEPGEQEERRAIACLSTIAEAAGSIPQ